MYQQWVCQDTRTQIKQVIQKTLRSWCLSQRQHQKQQPRAVEKVNLKPDNEFSCVLPPFQPPSLLSSFHPSGIMGPHGVRASSSSFSSMEQGFIFLCQTKAAHLINCWRAWMSYLTHLQTGLTDEHLIC